MAFVSLFSGIPTYWLKEAPSFPEDGSLKTLTHTAFCRSALPMKPLYSREICIIPIDLDCRHKIRNSDQQMITTDNSQVSVNFKNVLMPTPVQKY